MFGRWLPNQFSAASALSLFQATTYGRVVATMNVRKQPIKRWFYFDMVRWLASAEDREDAIIGVPETRILRSLTDVKLDLSLRENEFDKLHFPCEKLFDTFDWQNGYLQYWKFDPAKTELFMRFQSEVLQRSQSCQIPVIKLKRLLRRKLRDDWYGSVERKVAGAQPERSQLAGSGAGPKSPRNKRRWLPRRRVVQEATLLCLTLLATGSYYATGGLERWAKFRNPPARRPGSSGWAALF